MHLDFSLFTLIPCAKVMVASIINKTNVPADLQSAGIKYKDLLIRLKYRCFTKVRNEKQA